MALDPRALRVYVDGSALKNPGGPGGCAGIVEYPPDWNRASESIFEEGYLETTNNRMELRACVEALKYVCERRRGLNVQRVLIISDSQYLCRWHNYAATWKRNNWENADGKPVENGDLWDELLSARARTGVRIEIKWMRGKSSLILKEVDRLAKRAATQPWKVDRGFRPGKVGRSRVPGRTASGLFPARGQEALVRVYRSTLVGRSKHKIYFDLFSPEKQEFTQKFHAYAQAQLAVGLHRGHQYKVRFNDDPTNPVIEEAVEK